MMAYSSLTCECEDCQRKLENIEEALSYWQQRLYKSTTDMLLILYRDLENGDVDGAQDNIRSFLQFFAARADTGGELDTDI